MGQIENSISLTASVIESSNKLSLEEFDKKYLEERIDLVELEGISIAYFPDLFESIRRVAGMHNNYWGHQRLLLLKEIKTDRDGFASLQTKVIEIGDKAYSEISLVKDKIIDMVRGWDFSTG